MTFATDGAYWYLYSMRRMPMPRMRVHGERGRAKKRLCEPRGRVAVGVREAYVAVGCVWCVAVGWVWPCGRGSDKHTVLLL
jgi:hypothetical protein